ETTGMAHDGVALDIGILAETAVLTDHGAGRHMRKVPDLCEAADLGAGLDDGRRMYERLLGNVWQFQQFTMRFHLSTPPDRWLRAATDPILRKVTEDQGVFAGKVSSPIERDAGKADVRGVKARRG